MKEVSMRLHFLSLSILIALVSSSGFGATYELIRLTVGKPDTDQRYIVRCQIQPGVTVHQAEVGGVSGERSLPLSLTDEGRIQTFVESVYGIPRPDFTNTLGFTNWWVRANSSEEFKLIRSNVSYRDGDQIFEDQSEAAKTLSVFMGINCLRVFGQ